MLNVKDYINELESRHPFLNKNIYIKCYQKNELNFTVECYIKNIKLITTHVYHSSMLYYKPMEWATKIQMALEKMLKQLMNEPFEEVLDHYYEEANMKELNEIANLWNDTKNFNEWVQAEREELGI